jgi:hypothetical protein
MRSCLCQSPSMPIKHMRSGAQFKNGNPGGYGDVHAARTVFDYGTVARGNSPDDRRPEKMSGLGVPLVTISALKTRCSKRSDKCSTFEAKAQPSR